MFAAKVITDGRFFIADTDAETGGDAHALEPGKSYWGNVLESVPTATQYVEYSGASRACFDSADLIDLPGDFRLTRVGG